MVRAPSVCTQDRVTPLPVAPNVDPIDLARAIDAAIVAGDLHRARRVLAALGERLTNLAKHDADSVAR